MKKTFRIAGIVLGAILFTVGLGACSDDDDSALSGGKRLKSVVYTSADGRVEEILYEYDARGRAIKSAWSDSEGGYEMLSYTYGDNKITSSDGRSFKEEFYLTDGLIYKYVQYNGGSASQTRSYEYDANRRLISIDNAYSGYHSIDEIEWSDGNLTDINSGSYKTVYTYTDIPAEKGSPDYPNLPYELRIQGYYGAQSRNLIASELCYGELVEYTYELEDGYVVKQIGSDGTVTTFRWE